MKNSNVTTCDNGEKNVFQEPYTMIGVIIH